MGGDRAMYGGSSLYGELSAIVGVVVGGRLWVGFIHRLVAFTDCCRLGESMIALRV